MNKKFLMKALAVSVTAIASATAVLGAAGCGDDGKTGGYDNDKDALVFSSQDFDKVFNPFYSTSAMDANAVGMTQIGMISNDKDGKPTYGDNEAVVTKDLGIAEITNGTSDVEYTEYYFVLKNNVKFSKGTPLTMKDVLFNIYEYLDPAYTGSSTMYSTDIVGLKKYRTQSEDENEQDSFEEQFVSAAGDRIDALVGAMEEINNDHTETKTSEKMKEYLKAFAEEYKGAYVHIVEDYKKAEELFKEELQQDFNNSKDSYEDIMFTNGKGQVIKNLFTTDVETFLYNEGYISWAKNDNDRDGMLHSTFTTDNEISTLKTWTEEYAIQMVYDSMIPAKMDTVVQYWGTATELAIYIAGDAREAYFKSHPPKYRSIDGVKFINRKEPVTFKNQAGETKTYDVPTYNADGSVASGNEVLKITINGVDPKAIWNFSFGVAPMYYYSDQTRINAFDYESNFGVQFNSVTFQSEVIKNGDKLGVPVGAGPYMACDSEGNTEGIGRGDFLANNVMYFVANPNYIMGEPLIKKVRYQVVPANQIMNSLQTGSIDFGEPNAKTENINLLNGLENKGFGYSNIQTAGYGYVGINASKVPSIYVRRAIMHSINPQIAVDYYKGSGSTQGTAKAIYRPMSLSSWAYPKSSLAYYPYIGGPVPEDLSSVYDEYRYYVEENGWEAGYVMSKEEQVAYIERLVKMDGYKIGPNGLYQRNNGADTLKYIFTIAGQGKDHPAFMALYQAGNFLTDDVGGFQIITKTDINALTKLSTGALDVWAAAWGSTIDPDMYQVYHKDSKASSVLNWGYNSILNNQGKYEEEYGIVGRLSDYIDMARRTNDQDSRAGIYSLALDEVMKLAVELPMYQRDDLFAYNSNKIDVSTFTPEDDRSAFRGLTADIYKLSLVTNRTK